MGNNYKNYSNKNNEQVKQESVVTKIADDKIVDDEFYDDEFLETITTTQETEVKKNAKVVNCVLLNVRKEASPKAEVIDVLKEGCDLVIIEREDCSEEFFEVEVPSKNNLHGFCMKQFVRIEQ